MGSPGIVGRDERVKVFAWKAKDGEVMDFSQEGLGWAWKKPLAGNSTW